MGMRKWTSGSRKTLIKRCNRGSSVGGPPTSLWLRERSSQWRVDPSVYGNCAIRKACLNDHVETVKLLVEDKSVDPSANCDQPIRWASEKGHLEIVKVLLNDETEGLRELRSQWRVDPSNNNNAAIRWASEKGHLEVVEFLLKDETEGLRELRSQWR